MATITTCSAMPTPKPVLLRPKQISEKDKTVMQHLLQVSKPETYIFITKKNTF